MVIGNRETFHSFLKRLGRGHLGAFQPHLCACEDHGTDSLRRYAETYRGQEGGSRELAELHQGQKLPDQISGLL